MRIAIIGWGSLIWCPGSLQIDSLWHRDGPALSIEYARISQDGRLTLVIHPGNMHQQTLWAAAVSEDIKVVRENLRKREDTDSRFIHTGRVDGRFSEGVADQVRDGITKWLKERRDVDACVWTALGSNWKDKQKSEFSIRRAVQYLSELQDPARAREYIQNTPGQIQTEVRAAARERLRWEDAELSSVLFAAD